MDRSQIKFDIPSVKALLYPESVAIIGVSGQDSGHFRPGGRAVFDHLRRFGYSGTIYPVNPKYDEIGDLECFPTVEALPETPDCAVVAVPAADVTGVIDECGAAGIRSVLLLTAGFGELGPEGKALEDELLRTAARQNVRVLGPNTTGIINVPAGASLSMTSALATGQPLRPGSIALLLQSGALGSSLLDRARSAGVGLSHMVSLGNQSDLDVSDFLAYLVEDMHTDAVCVYLEGITNGTRFREVTERLTAADKKLFVLLGGRNPLGDRAAASHTGRMSGRAELEESVVAGSGGTLVEDVDDLWRAAHLHVRTPSRNGVRRVGILTISGGIGVLVADQIGLKQGFELPQPSPSVAADLQPHLPDYVTVSNPLDLGPGTMPDGFGPALRIFSADDRFDVAIVAFPVVAPAWHTAITDALLDVESDLNKPLIVCWYGGNTQEAAIARLRQDGLVVVETPGEVARLLACTTEGKPPGSAVMSATVSSEAHVTLPQEQALRTLRAAGADVCPSEQVSTAEEAIEGARRLNWPVALKADVPGVAHKSEHGLVEVGIHTEEDLVSSVARIQDKASRFGDPNPNLLIQRMVEGTEVVLTVRRDPFLGDFLSIGLGGVLVELLEDVVHVHLPNDEDTFREAVARLQGAAVFTGYRGHSGLDLDWLWRTGCILVDVARQEELTELEVNPALVGETGGVIVDVLMVSEAKTSEV